MTPAGLWVGTPEIIQDIAKSETRRIKVTCLEAVTVLPALVNTSPFVRPFRVAFEDSQGVQSSLAAFDVPVTFYGPGWVLLFYSDTGDDDSVSVYMTRWEKRDAR